jgi:hypothetical protein
MRITAVSAPLLVQYKTKGKRYGAPLSDNQEPFNTGTDSTHPFDEVTLSIGQSIDVDGKVVAVRDLGAAVELIDSTSGS